MASAHAPLPVLACKPVASGHQVQTGLATAVRKPKPKPHTEAEWAAVYPHIQRLYMHERRKLRYVMAHMKEKYSFQAT